MGEVVADRTEMKEIGGLLREASQQFEEVGKRVESILDAARVKFEKDFSSTTAAAGVVLLGASAALAAFDKSATVAAIGLGGGVLLVLGALIMRQRTGESQLVHARTLIELEKERARFAQQSAVLQDVWLHGLPQGTSLALIEAILGMPLPHPERVDTHQALPEIAIDGESTEVLD